MKFFAEVEFRSKTENAFLSAPQSEVERRPFLLEFQDSCSEVLSDSWLVNASPASAIINKWLPIGNIQIHSQPEVDDVILLEYEQWQLG